MRHVLYIHTTRSMLGMDYGQETTKYGYVTVAPHSGFIGSTMSWSFLRMEYGMGCVGWCIFQFNCYRFPMVVEDSKVLPVGNVTHYIE